MNAKDKCLDLSVIPQFGGTCWFNAILMIALYSQNVRKFMIKASKKWDKSDSFLMIIKSILIKYYNQPEKVQSFFNKIRPEIILFKMLKKFGETTIIEVFKHKLKKDISYVGWYEDYIIKFLKFMNINTLDIVYINGNYYLNTDNEYIYKYDSVKHNILIGVKDINDYNEPNIINEKVKVTNEISKILSDIPDIITIKYVNKSEKHIYDFMSKKGFNSINYNFNIKGVDTYADIIELNGYKYKLDAVTLGNYNIDKVGHAIAGITCNDNRYVYNGWNSTTTDPAMMNKNDSKQLSPCSLMKYDWDLRKDESFCLNSKTCKLDFIERNDDLCFSFAKGDRILIYVRINDNHESLSLSSIPTTLKLSDVEKDIKEIHDIRGLTDDELIEQLGKFNYYLVPNHIYQRSVLESIYYDELKKYYNFQSIIKQSPVKKSKSPKNDIKNLSMEELIKNLEKYDSKFSRDELEKLYLNYLTPKQEEIRKASLRNKTPAPKTPTPKTPAPKTPTLEEMKDALDKKNIIVNTDNYNKIYELYKKRILENRGGKRIIKLYK